MSKKTKVHLMLVLVVDHDELGADEAKTVLENQKFPNWCMHPNVLDVQTESVTWSDDHPLNKIDTMIETAKKMFKWPRERT